MPSAWNGRGKRLAIRLLSAVTARSGRSFGLGAADIMAARTSQLRRTPRLPRGFRVRTAQPADESGLAALISHPRKAARLLSSGDVGLLATANGGGSIHAMEWARLGPAEYDWDARRLGLVFRLPARSCWLHNGSGDKAAVAPWAMILCGLPEFLEEQGIEVAFLQVACDDLPSVRCHESLGFHKVGRVVALRLFGWRLVGLRVKGQKWVRCKEDWLDLERLPV